ncbi:MAG: HAMP domain-containing protein [Chloroflexi bacterium]|nr:HAMP domain-containing protein [Chloroflexota bacterium]
MPWLHSVLRFDRWSLVTRVVFACVTVALVFAAATTAIGYVKASAGLTEQGDARLESDAVIITSGIDQWTGSHMDIARAVAGTAAVREFLAAGDAATPEQLAAAKDISDSMANNIADTTVSMYDAQGTMRYSQTASVIGQSFTHRDYWQNAIKGIEFISGVSRKSSDNSPAIFISVPVKDAGGHIIGVVNASGDPKWIQDLVTAQQKRSGGEAQGLLIDDQGLIIANTVDQAWALRPVMPLKDDVLQANINDKRWGTSPVPDPLNDTNLAKAIGITSRTVFSWNSNGASYHAVAMPLSRVHWTYVSALPVATFEATTLDLLKTSALAIVAGLLLAIAIIGLLMRPVATGLRQLTEAARRLARGDIDSPIQLNRQDELGQVAAGFREVSDYIRATVEVANAIAEGDLSRDVRVLSEQDRLGQAFERMQGGLRDLVGQLQTTAAQVAEASASVEAAAAQTGSAVDQVTQTVQSVAVGAQDTSRSAQETNAAVRDLSQSIDGIARGAGDQAAQVQAASATALQMAEGVEQVASNANSVAAASQQTRASAQHGAEAVHETVAGMVEIKAVVTEAAGRVQELGALGDRIGAVVETIDDIAEQTNLLALNAAIEAARAGEHGRGFAVVADEVRKLAERASRETRQITELINAVQVGTSEAVSAMRRGSASVEQGTSRATQAGTALDEILRSVEGTVHQVNEIAASAQQMAAASRSVVEAMESISAVVEENTASTEGMALQAGSVASAIGAIAAVSEEQTAATEEVSASAEEMGAQVAHLRGQAQDLASAAARLRSMVVRFKLDGATVAELPARSDLRRAA